MVHLHGGDFNLAVWRFCLQLQSLMYVNTTCDHAYYKTVYTEHRSVCQVKISTNVHYIPVHQTYCSPNIPHTYTVVDTRYDFLLE